MASAPSPKRKHDGLAHRFKNTVRRLGERHRSPSSDARLPPSPSGSFEPSDSNLPAPSSPQLVAQFTLHPTTSPPPQNPPELLQSGSTPANPQPTLSAEPSVNHKISQAAVNSLGSALQALRISAQAFTPLVSVVDDLLAVLDIVKTSTKNQAEYDEITLRLKGFAETLQGYVGKLSGEDHNGSAARILGSIKDELVHIQQQQSRSNRKRALEVNKDQDDLIKRYRQIEALFQQLLTDISLRTWDCISRVSVTSLLQRLPAVDEAEYDSIYSATIKRRGCTAETREKVQQDLHDWIRDPNGAKVYWMNGMAGTGKTTIAYSLCEWLDENQLIGGSFFCSRLSPSCRNVNSIIPTIAYQLARYSPGYRSALYQALENNPDYGKRHIEKQFQKLLQAPIRTAIGGIPEGVVIVIDALDECEDEQSIRLIIETLLKRGSNLPVKFFITSRPESGIRDEMTSPSGSTSVVLYLHDIEHSIVEGDIKKYLIESFEKMTPPPSHDQIERLAKLAGNLFIYAATVVRYILPGKGGRNPAARLKAVLDANHHEAQKAQQSQRYKHLDELYSAVLEAAFRSEDIEEDEAEAMRLVLWTVVCAKEPMSIPTLSMVLFISEEVATLALQPLLSVLHVSESSGLISTLHASFPDYMLDPSRSKEFHCDCVPHNDFLAGRCLDVMKEQLRFNICDLESSFVFDSDVADLQNRIDANISSSLFYACRYWGEHLSAGLLSTELGDKLADFFSQRLLFWLEVLNLKRRVVEGVSMLSQAGTWLNSIQAPSPIQDQANDAQDFMTRFAASACGRSTPHIYISAIPLCSKSSFVYECFQKRMQGLLDVKGSAMEIRKHAAQATWDTGSAVVSLAVSSDGTRILAGSSDKIIRVWDARTGDVVTRPFQAHTSEVTSVAFSLDGTRIVSGSSDKTIRVWDARTGEAAARAFQGHASEVTSVAFSPDGTCIVSGSNDKTVRVWDAYTSDAVAAPFQGHTSSVNSVAFSPDGARVVSGSGGIFGFSDNTIRVWGARTGDVVAGPFRGHTDSVRSVAFSPNGTHIVSGSNDKTIRVWDACTGDVVAGPLQGHTSPVNSVAFSPDGTRVVSVSGSIFGFSDNTIRVWDARTGDVIAGPFQGHTGLVKSVVFSPDGTRIVSGSHDCTIRVWAARTVDVIARPFQGHTSSVNSVAFSPDGTRIVSGSGSVLGASDNTMRVWDARTGDVVAGPFQGHTSHVKSVAFSPNSARIVSGSNDKTIRVWDAYTGDVVAGPFLGHTSEVNSVAFSPDGARVVSGSGSILGYSDNTIRVWDACTGDVVAGPFQGHTSEFKSVAFSPDGTRIVSGSSDKTVRVWDACTSDVVARTFRGHTSSVNSVAFSPDGTRIVSGSDDKTIRVWDVCTGDIVAQPFQGHTESVNSVAFSPDGIRIASGSSDKTIRVWDTRTGDVVAGPPQGHTSSVNSVAFSPDGTRIVSGSGNILGSSDNTIRVWDTRTGDVVAGAFQGHTASTDSGYRNFHDASSFLPLSGYIPAMDSGTQLPLHHASFQIHPDGWAMSEGLPLFWVPPDLRTYVPHPNCALVITPVGAISVDYHRLLMGEKWHECYVLL